jgi:hypothetical protein
MRRMDHASSNGKQWQRRINSLLRAHVRLQGEVYQEIPDETHGDGGLEGISSNGDGYQCYADERSFDKKDRTKKQKKKITEDLAKLEIYKDFWISFLQGSKLKRWFLVVPEVGNKEVVAHARKEAAKLRKQNLPFLDPDFQAFVVTEEYFEEARQILEQCGALSIEVTPDALGEDEVSAFVSSEADFIKSTDEKLAQVYSVNAVKELSGAREKFLVFHLESSNIIGKLFQRVPELWERLQTFLAQEENTVAIESELDDSRANVRLMRVRTKLSNDLANNFRALSKATVDRISWGTVAGWIGECPLKFRKDNE